MKMTLKLSRIALAMATLGTTPAALALTPTQIAAGPTTYVWLSGSSSTTNAVFRSVMSLCNGLAGNLGINDAHMYLEGGGIEPGHVYGLPNKVGSRFAYACTMSSAAGSLNGKKVVMYHTVEGGSFNAHAPHLSMAGEPDPQGYLPGNLKRLNNLALLGGTGKCAAGPAGSTLVTLNGVPWSIGRYTGCDDVVTKTFTTTLKGDVAGLPGQSYPDGGFSDTEYLINKQNLDIALNLSSIGDEVAINIGQAFGVAVSYPLYLQLQKNDVAAGVLAATCDDGSATVPNLTPACQPSLPAQRYTTIANRDSIGGVDGGLFGGPAGSIVNLVRRVPTSGTQSASNLRFSNKPCATGLSQGALEPARATDSTPTAIVTEQSTAGHVKDTLNTATGAGQFALGVVSMENIPTPTATNNRWAFVKLDDVSPNFDTQQRAKAMDGAYTFWYELAVFTAGGSISPASPSAAALITAVAATLGESDLKGIFATPLFGGSGSASKGARFGNSCLPAGQ
ncbi:hypothetical protein [Nitrosovibrio sp. Nv4]|uniref:hypothetical protein n=1 Tax=Nitrosovibrio sp. Nv4 TaxID=1945880 RepID=UPI000BC7D490|nr:hypothetical protein [Nitrosovibrio sp. Nv4]SOD40456.1 hypothetical protein SAMN06298226_0726 [Nitrosovibrio sp. Nv4]